MSKSKKSGKKQYCSIFSWLKNTDAKFADALEEQCLQGYLKPRNPKVGITFLYPSNKKLRDTIIDALSGAEAMEGVKMISKLIIRSHIPNVQSLGKDASLPNGMNHKVIIKKPYSTGKVELDGGFIKDEPSFVARADRGNINVLSYDGAKPPAADENSFIKAPEVSQQERKGGFHTDVENRVQLAKAVESRAILKIYGGKYMKENPYLYAVVSYLNFCKVNYNDHYNQLLPILDYGIETMFYILFEPYNDKPCLAQHVQEWITRTGCMCGCPNPAEEYLNIMASYRSENKGVSGGANNMLPASAEMLKIYNDHLTKCPKIYKGDLNRKLYHDELRFVLQKTFNEIPVDDVKLKLTACRELNDLIFNLESVFNGQSSEHYIGKGSKTDPVSYLSLNHDFASSSAFFYLNVNKHDGLWLSTISNSSSKDPINLDNEYKARLEKMQGPNQHLEMLKKQLNSLDADVRKKLFEGVKSGGGKEPQEQPSSPKEDEEEVDGGELGIQRFV